MTGVPTATVRCEIDRSCADLAPPLLRSFVHHQCVLTDCDVATVDALEAAVAEVADAVIRRRGVVTAIELAPDVRCVDIRLSVAGGRELSSPRFRRGPVARAARLWASFGRDGRLRLVHRFTQEPRS